MWASELVGAQVVTRQGFVGLVAGLILLPQQGVRAFRVDVPGAAELPRPVNDTSLLPFDAVEAIEVGLVRVQGADDVVPAFKLPSLLAHLTSPGGSIFGLAVRSAAGQRIGHLWDALLDVRSGHLLAYRIGPTPQQDAGEQGVLTTCPLRYGLNGEFTVAYEDAQHLSRLLEELFQTPHLTRPPTIPKGVMDV